MLEKTEKQTLAWPETASVQLTKTLDSFLASASGSMPQAYLFMGSSVENSEARKLVDVFTKKIIGSSGISDIVIFDVNEGTGIDGIREVLSLAALIPVASKQKVVLMLNMDKASTQMLNALLKTLEEPAKHSIFLLLSSRPLLATVMSRCQVFSSQDKNQMEMPAELSEGLQLLVSNRSAGQAERMVLVNELADMTDELLPQVIEAWLYQQVAELRTTPQKYSAVRATMETLQSLRGNFNKKMVLQQFVTTALI